MILTAVSAVFVSLVRNIVLNARSARGGVIAIPLGLRFRFGTVCDDGWVWLFCGGEVVLQRGNFCKMIC